MDGTADSPQPRTRAELLVALKQERRRRRLRRVLRALAWALSLTVALAAAALLAAFAYYRLAPAPAVPQPQAPDISTVLARDGQVIATITPGERHLPLTGLPHPLAEVVVAAEDARFWSHPGVDPVGIARAAWADVSSGAFAQGGSTITQQLIKVTSGQDDRSLERKMREARLAVLLERDMPKEEILSRYLDAVWLGSGGRGAQTAARAWFHVDAADLTLGQAAMIAAVLPAPSLRDPVFHPEVAEQSRQQVLGKLAGAFPAWQVAQARRPVRVHRPWVGARVSTQYPWLVDTVRRELSRRAPDLSLESGGLRVFTTFDLDTQQAFAGAIRRVLRPYHAVSAAAAAVEPCTGGLVAVVGGRDWSRSQVNAALGALGGGTGRQMGSTAKMLALVTALEHGWGGGETVDAPARVSVGGFPLRNYDGRSWGQVSLTTATQWSINTAYANLARQVGPEAIAQQSERMGIRLQGAPVDSRVVTGVHESSPVAVAGAWAALACQGAWVEPHAVDRVQVSAAGVDVDLGYLPNRQATSRRTAAAALTILRHVVTEGTGVRARSRFDAAGKTGTTDEHADAWFAGTTKALAAVVWMGHLDSLRPVDLAGVPITGGWLPAMIWKDAVVAALRGDKVGRLPSVALSDRLSGLAVDPVAPAPASSPTPRPSSSNPESTTRPSAPDTGTDTDTDTDLAPSDPAGGTPSADGSTGPLAGTPAAMPSDPAPAVDVAPQDTATAPALPAG